MLQGFWNRWITTDFSIWDWNINENEIKGWQEALTQLIPASNESHLYDHDDAQPPRVKQTETWDCGIACLLMALQWLQRKAISVDEERLEIFETVGTQSIWSIDLVHLLETYKAKSVQFSYLFCSKTLTVDQAHKDLSFYQTAFNSDQVRVTRLFERAHNQKWNLLQVDLAVTQVLELVRRPDCIAIALVDHAILLQRNHGTQYSGHFIVLSGVRCTDGQLQVHNPTSMHDTDFITPSLFEKAWTAKGTDKDIIFLVKS